MKYITWGYTGIFVLLLFLLFVVLLKGIVPKMGWIKDGLNKKEFTALFFLGLLIYMYYVDGNRIHEWSHFSDLQYITSYVFISVGLGLKEILEAIYIIKGIKPKDDDKER